MRVRPSVRERDDEAIWDIATPARPLRAAGVTMAGFDDRGRTPPGLRLIPHPAVTLGLTFGAGSITLAGADGLHRGESFVAGLGLGFGSLRLEHAENLHCLQVRLSPVIAHAVLGVSLAELDGVVVALDDLWGPFASRISARLAAAATWEDRFALVDALIARRCAAMSSVEPEVDWAWHRIAVTRGRVRVDGLAAELGWSRKRLWSRFQTQVGMPPKRAARLVRFDHAVHRLVAGQEAAGVAADGGYTDQSHLHRDVMTFTGLTPVSVAGEPFLTIDDIAWPATMAF